MITKHLSAEKMAQEIAEAVINRYENSDLDRVNVYLSASKAVVKEFSGIISPLRTEVVGMVRKIVAEKTNSRWFINIVGYEAGGLCELNAQCMLTY